MIGFVVAWVLLTLIAVLLIKVVLKRPSLTKQHRLQGIALGLMAVLFLGICSIANWALYTWSPVYSEPPIVSGEELDPQGNTWGRFQGKVSETSTLKEKEKEKGYVAYLEFDSAMSRNRETRWYEAREVVMELVDGTKIDLSQLHHSRPAFNWNWQDESNYRFLKRGDDIVAVGYASPLSKANSLGATHALRDLEFVYRGNESGYQQSALKKWLVFTGYAHLALTGLFAITALISLIGLLTRLKTPKAEASSEAPAESE